MDYSLLVGLHSIPKGNTLLKSSLTILEPTEANHHRFRQSRLPLNEMEVLPKEYSYNCNHLFLTFFCRKRSNDFYGEDGGFQSSLSDNSPGDELYFLGIIDILTPYDSAKKIEHVFKSLHYNKVKSNIKNRGLT